MKKISRRTFVATASLAGIAITTDLSAHAPAKQALVHHVFFWLKNNASADDLNKLIEGVNTLKAIKAVKKIKVGLPANTTKRDVIDDSYSLSLLTFFDDVKGHDQYQVNPIHLKFVEEYAYLWQKVVVYDAMDL